MNKTICYTGIGANKNGLHSEKEFRELVKSQKLCKTKCPKKLNDWIDWYGAGKTSENVCKNVVKLNNRIQTQNEKVDEAIKNLKKCINDKCDHAKENPILSSVCTVKHCIKEGAKYNRVNKLADKASDKARRLWEK